jgi:hypothetical protein
VALMAEWSQNVPYETRVQTLFGDQSGDANGGFLLDSATVLPPAAVSQLFGGPGQDWFWLKPADKLNGYTAGETVTLESPVI